MRSAPPADQSVKVSRAAEICSVSRNEMKLSPVRLGERSLIMILHSFHSVPSTFSSTHGFFTLIQLKHTHTRTPPNPNPHTYVHMHLWSDVEYVNRHLLQHPISSSHHVSDMLMQPTEGFFLPLSLCLSTSPRPLAFPLASSPQPRHTRVCQHEQMRQRRGGGREEKRSFTQNLIMMLLWMDVTHTNRHVSNGEEPGILENNGGGIQQREAECGRKDKAPSSCATQPPPPSSAVMSKRRVLLPPWQHAQLRTFKDPQQTRPRRRDGWRPIPGEHCTRSKAWSVLWFIKDEMGWDPFPEDPHLAALAAFCCFWQEFWTNTWMLKDAVIFPCSLWGQRLSASRSGTEQWGRRGESGRAAHTSNWCQAIWLCLFSPDESRRGLVTL